MPDNGPMDPLPIYELAVLLVLLGVLVIPLRHRIPIARLISLAMIGTGLVLLVVGWVVTPGAPRAAG
jgi:energy-converting hydrogenase Eha subunit C